MYVFAAESCRREQVPVELDEDAVLPWQTINQIVKKLSQIQRCRKL